MEACWREGVKYSEYHWLSPQLTVFRSPFTPSAMGNHSSSCAPFNDMSCMSWSCRRPKPGLSTQHLTVINTVASMCNGRLSGNELQSTHITYLPSEILHDIVAERVYVVDTNTAASVTLIIQSLLPLVILQLLMQKQSSSFTLRINGGTHVAFSPPLDFFQFVLFPLLTRMNIDVSILSFKQGFYPVGRGYVEIRLQITSERIAPINFISRETVKSVHGVIWETGLNDIEKQNLASYLETEFRRQLKSLCHADCSIEISNTPYQYSIGEIGFPSTQKDYSTYKRQKYKMLGCQLWCRTDVDNGILGANAIMESGGSGSKSNLPIDSRVLARDIVSHLYEELSCNSVIDEHTADQLLIFMACAAVQSIEEEGDTLSGVSQVLCEPFNASISTLHIETAIRILEQVHDYLFSIRKISKSCRFTIEVQSTSGCRLITCRPILLS
jgi:RNA 3'-terminal phosphate cyclase